MDKVSGLPALNKCEPSVFIHLTRGGSDTPPPPPPQPHLKRLLFSLLLGGHTTHSNSWTGNAAGTDGWPGFWSGNHNHIKTS